MPLPMRTTPITRINTLITVALLSCNPHLQLGQRTTQSLRGNEVADHGHAHCAGRDDRENQNCDNNFSGAQ